VQRFLSLLRPQHRREWCLWHGGFAASLKGKSVGTNRASIGHFVTLRALASAGSTGNDVNFRLPPPAQAKLALTAGIGRCMDPPGSLKPHSPGPTVTRVFWSMGAARRVRNTFERILEA
jgi:hypothetical protein